MSEWKRVSDVLPEDCEPVLVSWGKKTRIGMYVANSWLIHQRPGWQPYHQPVWWMPLPERPGNE